MSTTIAPIQERRVPRLLRLLGVRWRRAERRSFRMTWGELSFGRPGWALGLHLFDDPPHFSLQMQLLWLVNAYIQLPFLRRFAREPHEIMESWGASYDAESGSIHLRWGSRYKILTMLWRNWRHMSHEVMRADGSWVPFVGEWEREKAPDGRHSETHRYYYLLRSGERQERNATIHAERRIWRLSLLRWTSRFQRVRYSIDVRFDDEVGERTGSWKGGAIGCSYDLRLNETPLECLRRMQSERRFT